MLDSCKRHHKVRVFCRHCDLFYGDFRCSQGGGTAKSSSTCLKCGDDTEWILCWTPVDIRKPFYICCLSCRDLSGIGSITMGSAETR